MPVPLSWNRNRLSYRLSEIGGRALVAVLEVGRGSLEFVPRLEKRLGYTKNRILMKNEKKGSDLNG